MEDMKLTDNFSLYELTKTNRLNFQDQNRLLTSEQINKLIEVAKLGETIRDLLGVPLIVHSGYRCPELNKAIGSSDRSQHLLCEAMDFVPMELDLGIAFRTLWKMVRDGKLSIGQLIYETASRSFDTASWIHASLGEPYRPKERCNQVLRMEDGKYTLFVPPELPPISDL